ncbi:hypothetical protein RCCS2_15024 [Roseobacter sp. CCS2]|nr:hypothetical protein RCCS2_15024 [Roseobacter sp. CCS2]
MNVVPARRASGRQWADADHDENAVAVNFYGEI